MTAATVIISGALLGLSIAAPVGPMGLLCINRTLDAGMWAGISTGAGASTVHVLYSCILLSGLDQVAPWLNGNRNPLSLLGAAVMFFCAYRLVVARRGAIPRLSSTKRSLLMAYATAALCNLTNPVSILLMVGGMTTVLDPASGGLADTRLLVIGLFFGSIMWWISLSAVTAALRSRISLRSIGMVDKVIATILFGFSAVAVARAAGFGLGG